MRIRIEKGYNYYKYPNINSLEELNNYSICSMWAKNGISEKLIELGYLQLESSSDDQEIFVIDSLKKIFYITHKHEIFLYFQVVKKAKAKRIRKIRHHKNSKRF